MNRKKLLIFLEEIKSFYEVDESLFKKRIKTETLKKYVFDFLENEFFDILKQDKRAYEIYYYLTYERREDYISNFFKRKEYDYKRNVLKRIYCFISVSDYFPERIYLDEKFREIFRKKLPKPKLCDLRDFSVDGKFNYKNEYILDDFKEALDFKNNNIKSFYSKLHIKEFFSKSNFARRFLANSVKSYKRKRVSVDSLKKFIMDILNSEIEIGISKILNKNLTPSEVNWIIRKFMPALRKLIFNLTDDFVSVENVIGYLKCNDGFVSVSQGELISYKINSNKEFEEKFIIPILKGYLFFLAAFGVIEIVFDDKNFDSLKGIKITEFGKFVRGEIEKINLPKKEKQKEEIIYSDITPFIKVKNPSSKTIAKLQKFAKKEKNGYRLDNEVFLNCNKDCIKEKIEDFKKTFKNYPEVIDNFIKNIEENLDSIEKEYFIVLKVDEKIKNKIVKINKKLGNILIPAKGNRILVSKENYEKLKKELIKNGIYVNI